jgi:hypothetical protein
MGPRDICLPPQGGAHSIQMPAQPIQFYNRLTQRLETEAVYGEGPLRFVYENALGKVALHGLVKRALFSDWYGRQMDAPSMAWTRATLQIQWRATGASTTFSIAN